MLSKKLLLTASLATTIALPLSLPITQSAQARSPVLPPPVQCQTTIALPQGDSLIYTLTGTFQNPVSSNTPQNPIGTSQTITVQRYTPRTGRITNLLINSPITPWEEIAPDADYSKLPFTGIFRGKPNDGSRLYKVRASAHGIYVSLRPTRTQPKQMQILHYTSPNKFLRSNAGTCGPIRLFPQAQTAN